MLLLSFLLLLLLCVLPEGCWSKSCSGPAPWLFASSVVVFVVGFLWLSLLLVFCSCPCCWLSAVVCFASTLWSSTSEEGGASCCRVLLLRCHWSGRCSEGAACHGRGRCSEGAACAVWLSHCAPWMSSTCPPESRRQFLSLWCCCCCDCCCLCCSMGFSLACSCPSLPLRLSESGLPLEWSVLRGGGVRSLAVTLCPLDVWHLSVQVEFPGT